MFLKIYRFSRRKNTLFLIIPRMYSAYLLSLSFLIGFGNLSRVFDMASMSDLYLPELQVSFPIALIGNIYILCQAFLYR